MTICKKRLTVEEIDHSMELYMTMMVNINKFCRESSKQLNEELSHLDGAIMDMQHDIELSQHDASKLAQDISKLRKMLRTRRMCKDNIHVINSFASNLAKVSDVITTFRDFKEKRKYQPKVLSHLEYGKRKKSLKAA